ncbi:GIY-YIG nuclease family protein [uncultured Roseovarius sp.]|uniref:GIY-YIG nuclease family protein n=1 Tax=uncultured Roseovarius sp. TaxID=293344 RepID=UPI00262EE4D6|nr:GIY-YIG nuclease family protein [uncultured Roseovarius sp.]
MALHLCMLLKAEGLDPADVSLVFHKTKLQPFRRMLPWLVRQRADLFEAYQAVHSTPAENTLKKRRFCASFVPLDEHLMMFVGVYCIAGFKELPTSFIYADRRYSELEETYGATDTGPTANLARQATQLRFDLECSGYLADFCGRLIVKSPMGRAYIRRADKLNPEISELLAEPQFEPTCPDWRELVLDGLEVRNLPESWRARLREWRGIYLIIDRAGGARYVGSAYGLENILGRWLAHVAGDVGVTRELKKRSAKDFRFSILERVSPDEVVEEVVALEHGWMNRLGTREWGLNA